MPTVYNKVTANNQTLIDLSQDTVADASHIRNGYVGHLNDGTQVTGSYSGSSPTLQAKTNISPTESSQTITCDSGYDGLSSVQINAISSSYVGSGVARESSSDLTASGATVTAPAGYYASDATKTIASGSATAPASISGSSASVTAGTNTLTFSKTVSVTPVVSAGYISSGTAGNSDVSLTASVNTRSSSDLTDSGDTVTAPAGYYASQATKSVASGTVALPVSASANSTSLSTASTSITLTAPVTITPDFTAGYISSNPAKNVTVSLTYSPVNVTPAHTYHPSTSDQTIIATSYMTGDQTIKGVLVTGLSANVILSGTTVKIGDSTDDDCVTSVSGSVAFQTYYTGSSTPSSALGVDGDIYLQTS